MQTQTEENYLKAIYKLSEESERVSTSAISDLMQTKSASVTDMLKRLHDKGLVEYKRYQGVTITGRGKKVALEIIRKHRLWEVFLVETLKFKWDEVHPIAEQLEHVRSKELVRRLEKFLGYPKVDPHGDPIPDRSGQLKDTGLRPLSELNSGDAAILEGRCRPFSIFPAVPGKVGAFIGYRDPH